MNKTSRRALARYAADRLLAGDSPKALGERLAAILAETGRTNEADFLLGDIAWELEKAQKLAIAQVTSATALSQELETEIKDRLKKATKAGEVLLQKNVDKSVLGGVRIETSGQVWDLTVARTLAELKEAF